MIAPIVHHDTPLTPRAALRTMAGRAFCVSFWEPRDAEVVEAVSPAIMFRQWSLCRMAGRHEARRALVRARRLGAVLRLARISPVSSRSVGSDPGCPWRAFAGERRAAQRLAIRPVEGFAALAHGWANRPLSAPRGSIRQGLSRLDRGVRPEGGHSQARPARRRLRGVFPPHGRIGAGDRQSLAGDAHDARRAGRPRVPFHQRRRDVSRTERSSL